MKHFTSTVYHPGAEKARGGAAMGKVLHKAFVALAWAFALAALGTIGAVERFQIGIGPGLAQFAALAMAAVASGLIAGITGEDDV